MCGQPLFFLTCQSQAQPVGNFTGNIFLHVEDVSEFAVVPPAPQFGTIANVN